MVYNTAMKIDLKSLEELCSTHSVSGDTLEIILYLQNRLQNLKIDSEISSFGVLLFGNRKNPKMMISAHADEVGFQVIKKNEDGTFLVNKSGHIDAIMLNNTAVYVKTQKGIIEGSFYPKKELGNNKPAHFTEIVLDTTDNNKVEIGDFGSYKRVFSSSKDKVIATALDNKIGVEAVLELVQEYPEMLKDTLFAFVTEEEITYDCIAGISQMYKPEYVLVLDMVPVNQVEQNKVQQIPAVGSGPAILYAMHSYKLNPLVKKQLETFSFPHQKAFLDIDFPPEPQIVQRNGVSKGINIFIPLLGWHSSVSTLYIEDFIKTKKLTAALYNHLH